MTALFNSGKGLLVNFEPIGVAKTGTVGIYMNEEGNFGSGGPKSTSATISVAFTTSGSSMIAWAWINFLLALIL